MKSHFFSRLLLAAAIACPAAAQTTPSAETLQWHADGSINYSRGDYGFADDTEVIVGLMTVTAESTKWRLQALLPAISMKGPASVVGGAGSAVGFPTRPTSASETGTGDITLGATYKFGAVYGDTQLDLGGQIKLPTADDERGLGTGEIDGYLQADFRRSIGNITPFATLGYRFLGTNSRFPLRDGFHVSLGFVNAVTSFTSLGASCNWRQRIVRGGDHSSEVIGFALHQLNERWRLQGYVLAGFTDASPNFGCGLSAGFRF